MITPETKYKLAYYSNSRGEILFEIWSNRLDSQIQSRILKRLSRFRDGNLGDYQHVGFGVYEARFTFGPGYRVYFGIFERTIVVVLCAGDKSSQRKDILNAKSYWIDYQKRTKDEKTESLSSKC